MHILIFIYDLQFVIMQKLRLFLKSTSLLKIRPRNFTSADSKTKNNENPNPENAKNEEDEYSENQEDYETYNQRSIYSRIFRMAAYGSISLLVLQSYFGYNDQFQTDMSKERALYIPFFYKIVLKMRQGFIDVYDFIISPPVKKFLPDQPPVNPMMHLKTLVLNFEGTLVSKDFEAGSGVMLHLRPDLMTFLQEMSKLYEIVVYTNEDSQFLQEAILTIDPMQRYFRWTFGRDYFVLKGRNSVKDIRCLNRDMRKVIAVDMDTQFYGEENPENVVLLKKYSGEEEDDSLVGLRKFLTHLARPEVKDVRKEIKKYGGLGAVGKYKEELTHKIDRLNRSRGFFSKKANIAKI